MPNESLAHSVDTIAAIDLGSNSFHMLVAKPQQDDIVVIDQLREMVRLAAGLDAERNITPPAMQAALDCLSRFGQRIKHLNPRHVRIVGTNTLRKAHNAQLFLQAAQEVLGYPIEIIAGIEEARLIYLGVSHNVAQEQGRRLVIDIGGGSTEFIIGERYEPLHLESLYMGCVSMSQSYFNDGAISRKRMRKAELAACMELEPHITQLQEFGWTHAIGASGTIRAIDKVIRLSEWSSEGITPAALEQLQSAMLSAGHIDKLKLPGLKTERLPVFPGGVMILKAIFTALGIERMVVSDGALREGLLYDLIGREQHTDTRSRTVTRLAKSYAVDMAQAARVEATALAYLRQVEVSWSLQEPIHVKQLGWASQLHEIGFYVAHSQYHKHGAYILQNADMLGFSRQEQLVLATLVRAHRRSFPAASFKPLPNDWALTGKRLAILLRLASLLHRSRHPVQQACPDLQADKNALLLQFPVGWLEEHPLTQADLEQEASFLKTADFELSFS